MHPAALTRKLLRDSWAQRGQFLAIAAVLAAGVATLVATLSTLDTLERTRADYYRQYDFAQVFAHLKRAPESLGRELAALSGVQRLETRVVGEARLSLAGFPDPVNARLVSLPRRDGGGLNALFLRAGRLPEPDSEREVVASQAFATAHQLRPGDELAVILNGRLRRLRLVGIGLSPEYVYQIRPGDLFPDPRRYAVLWMEREGLAAALDLEGAFNDVVLRLAPGASQPRVIELLDRRLERYGGLGAYGRDRQLSARYLDQELEGMAGSATTLPLIFLGVAAFLLNVVVGRIVERQRGEIAVLKACGYGNLTLGLHYLAMAALVAAVGCALGMAIGARLGLGLARLYQEFFHFPFLSFELSARAVAWSLLASAAAAAAGSLQAVRRAAALPPAEAMRPAAPAVYRRSLVDLVGLARWLDPPSRMVFRHLARHRLKTALSVLGVAVSLALLVAGGFQSDTVDYMLRTQFGFAQRQDLSLVFTEPTGREALSSLAALPGVRHVEPVRSVPVTLRLGHRSEPTAIQGLVEAPQLYRVLERGLQPLRPPPAGLVISEALARQLGAEPGDRLEVEVREGRRQRLDLLLTGVSRELVGSGGYMALPALNRVLGEGPVISGAYLTADPEQRKALLERLRQAPRVAGVSLRRAARASFEESLGRTIEVFAVVNALLAGSIAFGVVYNTARLGLSERGRELASLRVLGFTRAEVAYILLGELTLITLLALGPGLALGYAVCAAVAESFSNELYRIPLVVEAPTYASAVLVVLSAALLSGLLVLRRLQRLDIIEVLKTRE